jgi:TRAP-type mannitol/chloroaromatic compound transport system permease small subunit
VQPSESNPEPATPAGPFCRAVDRLSGFFGGLAALAVLGILVLVCTEILMRNLFGRSTLISDELAGYLNAAAVFLALGYTLREGAFIRVDTLYLKMRGRVLIAARWVFTLLTATSVAVLLVFMAIHIGYLFRNNVRSDSLTQTPLYIPESVAIAGLAVLLLQLITYVVKRMRDVP